MAWHDYVVAREMGDVIHTDVTDGDAYNVGHRGEAISMGQRLLTLFPTCCSMACFDAGVVTFRRDDHVWTSEERTAVVAELAIHKAVDDWPLV